MGGAPLAPDRDEARQLLEEELADPGYAVRESWVRRAADWVLDRLPDVDLPGQLPSWASWAALGLVLLAVVAVLAFAARDRWRSAALQRHGAVGGVFADDERLTAAAYRERARGALADGDPDAALLDAYRSIAAAAAERTLLDPAPGRTAHEVALALAAAFPPHAPALTEAADRFDAVRYGGRRATSDQAREVLALDERLAAARPLLAEALR